MSVPLGFSEIPQILGGHVSLVSVTTTLMLPIQKPVTRRREGASSACTTQKGTIASSASMDTTVMLFGRTAEVRCTFIHCAHYSDLHHHNKPPFFRILLLGYLFQLVQ